MALFHDSDTETVEKTREEIKEPAMYRVLLHNDDYTTMDFVVGVLELIFYKSYEAAVQIMLDVHKQGIGVCGVYTLEVAETKVNTVTVWAGERGFPLKCTMEEDTP